MMICDVLTSSQECQDEEETMLSVCEHPASLFPLLPSQYNQADEVVWIEGTITVSF